MNRGLKPGIILLNVLLGLLATGLLLPAAVSGNAQANSPAETSTPTEFLNTLSAQERAWLRDHPVIRVAQDPGWPPIEFTDERGTPSGMTADYLRLVEGRLGVKFQQEKNMSWQEAYARMKRWEIDMTTSVAVTPERETFWAFTKTYMTIPLVIVTRSDATYIADLRELEGKKVVVVAGYVAETWIARDFPEIQLVRVQSTQEALSRLQHGEVFACVDNMLVVDHVITNSKMSGLKISGNTPYNNAQSMAVRKDWAILAGILDQALDSISATERNTIFRKWLPLQYQPAFDYTRLWPVAAILAVVLMGLVTWNWKLAAEIRQRKKAEAALRASEQEFRSLAEAMPQIAWSTRPDGWYIYFNQQWMDYTGLTLEESYGHGWNKPFHPDDQQRAWDAWQNATQNNATYSLECRLRRADGAYRWWLIRGVPMRDAGGKIFKWFGTFTDIEEIKQSAEALRQSRRAALNLMTDAVEARDRAQQASQAQRASEESYRTLFSQMQIGFTHSEIICDAQGRPINSRYLAVNPAFERITGRKAEDVAGKTILDVFPALEPIWIETFGRVALTGEPEYFESHAAELGITFDVSAFCPAPNQYACTFSDITESRRSKEKITKQLEELLRWQDAMLDREDRVIELKKEVNEQLARAGQLPRYPSAVAENSNGMPDGSQFYPGRKVIQ